MGIIQGIPISELRDPVIQFHRSATHSLFLILILLLFGLIIQYSNFKKYKKYGTILIAFAIGITIHVLLDFFYLDGVSVLWPFITDRIYLPLDLPILAELPNNFQRFYAAVDVAFDGLYWIIAVSLFSNYLKNYPNDVKKEYYLNKKRQLTLGGVGVIILFSFFALFGLLTDILSVENFMILIYLPGGVVLLISCLLPLKFREIFIKIDKIPKVLIKNRNKDNKHLD